MLTDDVIDFIQRHIRSIWALQLVLLMHASGPRGWTAEELNRELRGSAQLIADILSGFEAAGLVQRNTEGRYRWEPPAETRALVDRLESVHAEQPLSVVNAIYTRAPEPIRTLADAFKFKKD